MSVSGDVVCSRCGYSWTPRNLGGLVRVCPRCKVRLDYGKWKLEKDDLED